MKSITGFLLSLVAVSAAWAQPSLPPQERPRVVATVLSASERDGIVLQGGKAAPVAEGVQLRGVGSIAELAPGDLVELVQDENGLVQQVTVLPRLGQRRALVEVISGTNPTSFFWWRREGEDFPNSINAADATVPLQVQALALEATVAYLPAGGEGPVTFAVLDSQGTPLWERGVVPGGTAELRCPVAGTGSITLRCRRPDGSAPDHTHCVWGSPAVLLRELGSVQFHPQRATGLVGRLAEALGGIDPGAIAVAKPIVIGLSQTMATDLQHDLFVALGSRYKVAGLTSWPVPVDLSRYAPRAAGEPAADTVAAAELEYATEGSVIRVALISSDGREVLAEVETTLEP